MFKSSRPSRSFDDSSYEAVARDTRARIRSLHCEASDKAPWKWIENVRNFSIYTKQMNGYSVRSIGVVKGCVHEVMTLLASSSQDQFEQKMAAIHGNDFKHGVYVADVAVDSEPEMDEVDRGGALSIRRATFARAGWFSPDDEWCYLDENRLNASSVRFEKYMTTLSAQDAATTALASTRRGETKQFRDAIAAYLVQPEERGGSDASRKRGASVRVHFYGELTLARKGPFPSFSIPTAKRQASVAAIQSRLLQIARDCDRIALLVRRRRLGIQVLVDRRRVIPAIKGVCVKCEQAHFVAKQCRVCGQTVCSDCSEKYERETQVRSHFGKTIKRLEMVRVCDPCLARVESADYTHMCGKALAGPVVYPDPLGKDGMTNSAAVDLKALLQDALLNAPSPHRKTAVLSVIRQVLDQEKAEVALSEQGEKPESGRNPVVVSLADGTDDHAIKALDNLVLPNIPHDHAAIADQEGRSYPLTRDYEASFTQTENEDQRIQAIQNLQVLLAAPCEELDIICDLAAKEVGVFASIVSIITEDEMRVVAANDPSFKVLTADRAHSFCTHTIMDDKPLIIPNPEADVRVSYTKVATTLGARFYCGFPIVVDGDRVLGSLCCLDQQKHELTESQYTAMSRLAETAAKIIKVRGEIHRHSSRADTEAPL